VKGTIPQRHGKDNLVAHVLEYASHVTADLLFSTRGLHRIPPFMAVVLSVQFGRFLVVFTWPSGEGCIAVPSGLKEGAPHEWVSDDRTGTWRIRLVHTSGGKYGFSRPLESPMFIYIWPCMAECPLETVLLLTDQGGITARGVFEEKQ